MTSREDGTDMNQLARNQRSRWRRLKYPLLFMLILAFHLCANLAWLSGEEDFDGPEDIWEHLNGQYGLYEVLSQIYSSQASVGLKITWLWKVFNDHEGLLGLRVEWPILSYLPACGARKVLGDGIRVTCLSNLFYLSIIMASVYAMGLRWGNRHTAITACILVSFYPGIYGLSRFYGLDFPLIAAVSLSLFLAALCDGFRNRGYSILMGILYGIGILIKGQFGFFVVGPTLFILARGLTQSFRGPEAGERTAVGTLSNFILCVSLALLVSSLWWYGNIGELAGRFMTNAGMPVINSEPFEFLHLFVDPGTLQIQDWSYHAVSMLVFLSPPSAPPRQDKMG
ncbi:ArnT family glycosyltransferase [Thermodesulfobacteriota bacterium]